MSHRPGWTTLSIPTPLYLAAKRHGERQGTSLQAECQKSGLTVVVSREHGRRLALMGAASGQF